MKIGLFDSGLGGLTVLTKILEKYKDLDGSILDLVYLADTINAPYGARSQQELKNIINKNIDFLYKQNCDFAVIACNSASIFKKHTDNNTNSYLDNCIDMVTPTVNFCKDNLYKNNLIFATTATINSNIYKNTFENYGLRLDQYELPELASLIDNNINIKIPQGSKVAFVGHSGSGKTTITRLLLRAYDYNNLNNKSEEGENYSGIKINSVELKDIDAGDLRKHIGYVEQHVDLFDDTVKNNILFGVDEKVLKELEKEQVIDSKIEEISKLARIDEFYHRLGVRKFETEIGERSIKLSGGERQRIGIARAIIKNPSILIFDEATSSLDTVNEKYIKEAIDNVSKGRTTIIIAHRLSTIIDSDIIFVMDKGKVVANGTHLELLESSSHYQDLIQHQELK